MIHKPFPYLILNAQPASEPLTLDEAKLYLRVDGNDEDALIAGLITSARQSAEKYLRRSLITQTWLLTFDGYAPGEVLLPKGPVQSITSVKMIARDTTETVVSANNYYLNSGKEKLVFDASPVGHIIEILYVAGYGNASDVPASIKQGMLAHVADLYDMRSESGGMPENARNLYAPYKVVSL